MSTDVSRRRFLAAASVLPLSLVLGGWTKSRELPFGTDPATMQPGDYTWAPERSAEGPVILIVSLPEQHAFVYRNGELIAVSTCSTGRQGHRTPTGVFCVLQKDRDHVSSTYKGAKMPYMERLTWSGIALHAGNLPGYPASHGCVRLPLEFAHKLFGITHLGVVTIIADEHSQPQDVVHPGMMLPAFAEEEAREVAAKANGRKLPPETRHVAKHRPAKAVISIADGTITILEDGHQRITGRITVQDPGKPIGNHVFVLKQNADEQHSLVWTNVGYGGGGSQFRGAGEAYVINRIHTDPKTAEAFQHLLHPGFTLVITDDTAHAHTRSGRSFVIATHHEPQDWETHVFQAN
jgi:hypothetical protein